MLSGAIEVLTDLVWTTLFMLWDITETILLLLIELETLVVTGVAFDTFTCCLSLLSSLLSWCLSLLSDSLLIGLFSSVLIGSIIEDKSKLF